MSYQRVIPRDLFNEANLLKCYGQLYLCLEAYLGQGVELELIDSEFHDEMPFDIQQDPDTGGLTIVNSHLTISGRRHELGRPLNSRHPWPLYLTHPISDEVIAVFTDQGQLTEEMLALLPAR